MGLARSYIAPWSYIGKMASLYWIGTLEPIKYDIRLIVKPHTREIGCIDKVSLWTLHVKFQGDWTILNTNPVVSRPYDNTSYRRDIETPFYVVNDR